MRETLKQRKQNNNNYLLLEHTFKEYENKNKISKEEYKLIIKTFFYILAQEMMRTGKIYSLPKSIGTIGIFKFKNKHKILDYKYYRQTGERRVIKNMHSEGFAAKIHWLQHSLRRVEPTACAFKLVPARSYSRELAKYIKEENSIAKYYDK